MFNLRNFKLPKPVAKILDERTWQSPNEGLRAGVAGWVWAEFYFEDFDDQMRQRVSLKDAWVTKVENITETGTFELQIRNLVESDSKLNF